MAGQGRSQLSSVIVPSDKSIVSTVDLDCKLDLEVIALEAHDTTYNPKFAAVIMRIREPKTTALIFSSGKMVCIGAKSEKKSKIAATKYARIIQKLGFPARFKGFKIQNIVRSGDTKFIIRLVDRFVYSHGAFSSPMNRDSHILPGAACTEIELTRRVKELSFTETGESHSVPGAAYTEIELATSLKELYLKEIGL